MLPILIAAGAAVANTLLQNKLSQDAQDRQNEYNTPANQVARFKAAGLNPALMYTQGNAGNQPAPVTFGAPNLDPYYHAERVMAYRSMQRKARQDELDIRHKGISNEVADRELTLKNWLLEQEQKRKEMGYYDVLFKSQMAAAEQGVKKLLEEIAHERLKKQATEEDIKLKRQVGSEKEYFQKLRKLGIEKNDPALIRFLMNLKGVF